MILESTSLIKIATVLK